MNVQQANVALTVISFDGYADIWDTFFICLNRFWKDRLYKTYLITNNAEPFYENVSVIKTGQEISWSRRTRNALKEIDAEYILLFLEDYLIDSTVDNEKVNSAIEYMKSNDIDFLRIAPIPKLKSGDEFAVQIDKKQLYGVNLQAAVWKKSYLLRLLGDDDFSAWEFEARQKFGSPKRIDGKCFATNDYVIHYLNGIIQGKWYIRTVDAFKSMGIDIPLGDRGLMTDKDMKRENIRNFLSHSLPPRIIRLLKPLAKKMGMSFVTD